MRGGAEAEVLSGRERETGGGCAAGAARREAGRGDRGPTPRTGPPVPKPDQCPGTGRFRATGLSLPRGKLKKKKI